MLTEENNLTVRFAFRFAVEAADIDALGHVNNIVYLRWVQEVAIKHWRAVVSLEQQAQMLWIVVRHEIDYLHPALAGDAVTAETWVGTARGVKCERFTEMRRAVDNQVLASARSVWCAVDTATKRPRRIDPDTRARFGMIDAPVKRLSGE